MKTKILILGAAITAFTFSTFASDALLSPRAAGNQIKTIAGVTSDANPAQACRNNMVGSPKAVSECSSHTTMPGCMTVASAK